jgi:anhydro-N-acetylmuramic acid kinase
VAQFRTALGLMSGTSLDGVDVALLTTDGDRIGELGPARTFAYLETDRDLLRRALKEAASLTDRNARPGALAEAEDLVTKRHAEAVESFLETTGVAGGGVDLVGFHGQTVLHAPERGLTVQIGDGAALARRLGRPVVWDFRADDIAAGGQGAPLAPAFHRALAATAGLSGAVAFLNVGGVANVTCIDESGEPTAFDTGPGNALLDDFVSRRTGKPYDSDGVLAANGAPACDIVDALLSAPYFSAPPPKSLDRESFAPPDLSALSDADGAATLLAFTVEAVAAAVRHCPGLPRAWHVCGGGRRNGALMRALAAALAPARVTPVEALGFDGDAIEAQAFAYLAVRALDRMPLTFPLTTGVPKPLTGGRLSLPESTA